MDAAKLIKDCFAVIDSGGCISSLIAAEETKNGYRVVRPGEVSWLPIGDWEPGTICSFTPTRIARLVLLHARKPGSGAFTRLLNALPAHDLSPSVIEPTREFQATLVRMGWRGKVVNTRADREHVWIPRKT